MPLQKHLDKTEEEEQVDLRWYVVWQLFLSKFKFLRELIGDTGSQQGDNEPSEAETEQETPPSPQRGRQKSARQRRAPTEDTT
ncbi:hypothetical protein EK904_006409 [Melospiza melodia maxima]|nr:hypothetical protein EK904_006409 [Melospiza melodia maxima]